MDSINTEPQSNYRINSNKGIFFNRHVEKILLFAGGAATAYVAYNNYNSIVSFLSNNQNFLSKTVEKVAAIY